ncbi:MAG: PA2779 family protein [Gammaproteobacteria bacterium]|nr:PA2779 family protein [Gammaproteobacteria bacterium]
MKVLESSIVRMMVTALILIGMHIPVAQAEMLGTEAFLAEQQVTARGRVEAVLMQQEVAQQLMALGVDEGEAMLRMAALSDQELEQLATKMEALPAGGNIVNTAVLIFLVLLATDIMGYTDVFPFVKETIN